MAIINKTKDEFQIECQNYVNRIAEELENIHAGNALTEDGEPLTMWDYFADVLDYEFIITSRKEYYGVKAWVTLGGPSIWIDTTDGSVQLAWGTHTAWRKLTTDTRDEIDAVFEDYYNC